MSRGSAVDVVDVGVVLGRTSVLSDVSLSIAHGEVTALVGPNGAGKSTLLGVVAGDIPPTSGHVRLFGRPLDSFSAKSAAQHRSVLLQDQHIAFGFRVRRVVEMGRTPWFRTDRRGDDDQAVARAIDRADVAHLAERGYPSLSGGEKARTALARNLAQETPLVLLDEPTAALDIAHQQSVLAVVRSLAEQGCAVVVVLHDLSLAAAADRVCLMTGGRVVADGRPDEVLTVDLISDVYGHPVDVVSHDGSLVVVPHRVRTGVQVAP